MDPSSSTIVVVPCFNEAGRLDVGQFLAFVQRWPGRFLFVDDGSTDRTRVVLEAVVAKMPERFASLSLAQNMGKAEAVRQGMLSAFAMNAQIAGYWDADLATPLDAIPAFEQILAEKPGCDIVMGSRVRLLGRSITRKPARHYLGRLFATAASMALGMAVYDTQCGAKLLRVCPVTCGIFATPFSSRWIFDVEILLRLAAESRKAGIEPEARSYELPLETWRDMNGSKLRPADFAHAILDLGHLIGKKWYSGHT